MVGAGRDNHKTTRTGNTEGERKNHATCKPKFQNTCRILTLTQSYPTQHLKSFSDEIDFVEQPGKTETSMLRRLKDRSELLPTQRNAITNKMSRKGGK